MPAHEDVIMAVRHRELPAEGVQFHPESVLTPQGKELLRNFLAVDGGSNDRPSLADAQRGSHSGDRRGRRGDHLTADHAAAVLAEIMEGRAGEVQTGAFLIALRAKGETVPELVGLARTMRSLATPVETKRHDLVDTAGTGGGPSTFNVSTTRRPCRRRRGLRGGQARQPLENQPLGLRRPARSARRPYRPRARPGRGLHRGGRLRLHVRPPPSRGDGARRPGPQGAGGADDLQLPRPVDQPGRRRAPADRSRRPSLPGDDRRGAGRARQRAGDGRQRRGRPRRALDLGSHPRDRGRRRVHRRVVRRARRASGSRRGSWRQSPAAPRRRTRRRRVPSSPASAARGATSYCSTRARRSTSAGSPTTSAAASPRATEAIDSGAAESVLERLIAATGGTGV